MSRRPSFFVGPRSMRSVGPPSAVPSINRVSRILYLTGALPSPTSRYMKAPGHIENPLRRLCKVAAVSSHGFISASEESIIAACVTCSSSCGCAVSKVISPDKISGMFSMRRSVPFSKSHGRTFVAVASSLFSSSIVSSFWAMIGPASIFETVYKTVTPTGLSPASRDRWTGLAPLHLGSRLGWMLTVPREGVAKNRLGRYCPYAAVMNKSGLISCSRLSKNSLLLAFSGQSTGRPSSSATVPTGLGSALPFRFLRFGGWVITQTISYFPALSSCSFRNVVAATSGVPRNTTRFFSPFASLSLVENNLEENEGTKRDSRRFSC
mmetsp:Transcript_16622/g.38170  ORF Transcript_16622/g.38170 Transcript_16622/m.38170 type:complete len:323 (-) Transcript_16622:211-1179(-)